MTHDEWRRRHIGVRARLAERTARIPTCHPEREHEARDLCKPCYERWRWAQRRIATEATR